MAVMARRALPETLRELGVSMRSRLRYPVTGALLAAALVSMVAWNHAPVGRIGAVTVGRIWLVATALALLVEAGGPRGLLIALRGARRGPALVLLGGGLLALALIVVSAHTNGCQCSGGLYGVAELELWTLLALVAVVLEPGLAVLLMLGAVAGALVAGLLALAGVHAAGEVNSGTDRLVGTYGNPNFLAATQALVAPVALVGALAPQRILDPAVVARRPRAARSVFASAFVVLAAVAFLTFSRSGLLATAGGSYLALLMVLQGRRARLWALGAALVAAGLAALLYSSYNSLRTTADFGSNARGGVINPNGWETIATGLIGHGPAAIATPSPGVLRVTATGDWQGASVPLPRARVGVTYELRFRARTVAGNPRIGVGMEDNFAYAGPVSEAVTLPTTWTPEVLDWVPTSPAPHARAYFWAIKPGAFELRDLVAIPQPGPSVGSRVSPVIRLPTTITNDQGARQRALRQAESRFLRSRQSALHLALSAFVHHPLRGLGWERFPTYAAAKLHSAPLATHDEYTRYAAELGIGGALAILAMVGACAWAAIRMRHDPRAPAIAGLLASAAIALAFANLLETPNAALAIATAVAVAIGLASRAVRARPVASAAAEPAPEPAAEPR
jgi:hypothetical protein